MDNSGSAMHERDHPTQQAVWLRATISAALFGTIGALFGRWLGKRGNDRETHFAESVMTWGMGSFFGLLAAYSSFKASEHPIDGARHARTDNEETSLLSPSISPALISQDAPNKITDISSVAHEGRLQKDTISITPEK